MSLSHSKYLIFLLIILTGVTALSPAWAQGRRSMYPANDPQKKLKEDVEDIFGIYIINPSMRNDLERVQIKESKRGDMAVELWLFYDQRNKDAERVKCYAHRWLLLGRFGNGGGARTLFSRYPKIQSVDIIFYTLVSKRTVDRDGKYHVMKEPKKFLASRITRSRASKLNWAELEKQLSRDGSKCARAGERAVNKKWYGDYLGKR